MYVSRVCIRLVLKTRRGGETWLVAAHSLAGGPLPAEEAPGRALVPRALGLGWSWALSTLDPGGEAGLVETRGWGEGQSKKNPESENGAGMPRTKDARLGLPEGVSARDRAKRGPGGRARAGLAGRAPSLGFRTSFPQPRPPGGRGCRCFQPWGSPCLAPPATCLRASLLPALQFFTFNGSIKAAGGHGAGVFPFYRWENQSQSGQEVRQSRAAAYQRR